jgi:hypothetical protein
MPVIGVSHGRWATVPPVVATSTRVYVAGDSGTIYKSSDGGVTWEELTGHGLTGSDYVLAVESAAGGNDVVYLSNNSGARVSIDGGASWSTILGPTGGRLIWPEVGPDGAVYSHNSYRSTNHGTSWSAIPGSGFMESATAGKLWSGYSATQISRMDTDGTDQELLTLANTWNSGPTVRGQSDTMALIFGFNITSSPYLEKMVGTTASDISPPVTGDISDREWIWAESNDGGTTILALIVESDQDQDYRGQLWRSADGGSAWTKVADDVNLMPLPDSLLGPTIAYDPNDTSLWYVLGGNPFNDWPSPTTVDAVLWQSTDNGLTWNNGPIAAGETVLGVIRTASG